VPKPTKNKSTRRTKPAPKAAKPSRRASSAGASRKPSARPARRPARGSDQEIQTISFVSLGCPKNLVDSEKMLGLLANDGIMPVSHDPNDPTFGNADAVVVNTCGFLEASKDESLSVIHEAIRQKDAGNIKRVVVAGCLVQRHRAKMLEWAPGIDALIGVFDRDKIVEAVRGVKVDRAANHAQAKDAPAYYIAANALTAAKSRGMETTGLTVNGKDGKGIGYFEDDSARLRLTPRHYAYLRIGEGCNQNCAFCTIPSIRGKMRSKPLDHAVTELKELLSDGAFEILLIGQDTTSYGDDIGFGLSTPSTPTLRVGSSSSSSSSGPTSTPSTSLRVVGSTPPSSASLSNLQGLPALLEALSNTMQQETGQGWLRLMYAYPTNFSLPIIDAFAHLVRHGRLLPYLDIPLQHASDRMLAAMKRNTSRAQQGSVIRALRERIPGMAVRTTFISGFPGETEADHKELLEFIEEMDFEAVGVFEYSQEPGTVAGTMENDPKLAVPAEVKARRREEVMLLQQKLAFAKAARIAANFDEKNPTTTGTRFDVIIDRPLATKGLKTSGVSDKARLYQGRTYFQAPDIDAVTYVHSRNELSPGELTKCVIVASDGYDLIARPVQDLEKRVGLSILR
jgi:ribosomal protein S12 methylthiotransferase